jgi:hypothetical protein
MDLGNSEVHRSKADFPLPIRTTSSKPAVDLRTRWSSFLITHPSGRCFDGAAHGHKMYFEWGRYVRNRGQRDRYLHVLPSMRKAAQFVAM